MKIHERFIFPFIILLCARLVAGNVFAELLAEERKGEVGLSLEGVELSFGRGWRSWFGSR
jgi:hypothetical protein